MQNVNKILEYQSTPLRYHLIVCREIPGADEKVWNVGKTLVDFLAEKRESEYFSEEFAEKCRKLSRQYTCLIDGISNVLPMTHYGVLFEPSLQFDVNSFIRKLSQSSLVVLYTNGLIQDERLYLSEEESEYYINLNEINYLIL